MVVKQTQAAVGRLTLQEHLCNMDTLTELMTITASGKFTIQIWLKMIWLNYLNYLVKIIKRSGVMVMLAQKYKWWEYIFNLMEQCLSNIQE